MSIFFGLEQSNGQSRVEHDRVNLAGQERRKYNGKTWKIGARNCTQLHTIAHNCKLGKRCTIEHAKGRQPVGRLKKTGFPGSEN